MFKSHFTRSNIDLSFLNVVNIFQFKFVNYPKFFKEVCHEIMRLGNYE